LTPLRQKEQGRRTGKGRSVELLRRGKVKEREREARNKEKIIKY
jgi:hypothetical protein